MIESPNKKTPHIFIIKMLKCLKTETKIKIKKK